MAGNLQHRQTDHEKGLFHHSLINIIVLHQMTQNNITLETFIQSNVLFSSTSQSASPSTSSTPLKKVKISSSSTLRGERVPWPNVTPHLVEGENLTSTTSTKQGSQSQHEAPSQHEETFHLDSGMVDLKDNEENKAMWQFIMEKDAQRERLKENLSKTNFMISFLEQENQQLNVKQLILEKHEVYIGKEDISGKEVMDVEVLDECKEQVVRKRVRMRRLKRALEHQREQMTFADLIAVKINANREFWLDKVNFHLENFSRGLIETIGYRETWLPIITQGTRLVGLRSSC